MHWHRLLGALTPALVATALGAAPAEAKTCSLAGKERKLGPTYTLSLTVSSTSCATGEKLVKAYYRCRVANGGKDGTCRSRPLSYRCTEKRTGVISTQFDAKVTCRRGDARITHTYTQFT